MPCRQTLPLKLEFKGTSKDRIEGKERVHHFHPLHTCHICMMHPSHFPSLKWVQSQHGPYHWPALSIRVNAILGTYCWHPGLPTSQGVNGND